MMDRSDIIEHVKKTYGVNPDHPFEHYPNYIAFRHPETAKWFGLIMNVSPDKVGMEGDDDIDILDVKCDPADVDRLKNESGFAPAYHMNKQHWVSVILASSLTKKKVFDLIHVSFRAIA